MKRRIAPRVLNMTTEIDRIVNDRLKQQQQDERAKVRAEVERELATQQQADQAAAAKLVAAECWQSFKAAWPTRWQQAIDGRTATLAPLAEALTQFMAAHNELHKLGREYDQAAMGIPNAGNFRPDGVIDGPTNTEAARLALAIGRMLIGHTYGMTFDTRGGYVVVNNPYGAAYSTVV